MKNRKYMARLLTLLLAVSMIVTGISVTAFADEPTQPAADQNIDGQEGEGTEDPATTVQEEPQAEEEETPNGVLKAAPQTRGSGDTQTTDSESGETTVEYTVTFKAAGGKWADGTTEKPVKVPAGDAATAPSNPTRSGYTFDGWDKDFSNVTSDLTVNAKWKDAMTAPTLKGSVKGENNVSLSWNDVKADSYEVLCDGKSVKAGITETSYKYQCSHGSHKFVVRAHFADATRDSNVVKGTGEYLTKPVTKMKWYATYKKAAPLYKSASGSKSIMKVKKGTKAEILATSPKRCKGFNKPRRVKIKVNGKVGWASWGSVKVRADVDLEAKYTTKAMEDYANKFSSSTNYLVWVNEYTQHIYVFKGKKGDRSLIKSFRTTTGNIGQPISHGQKSLGKRRGRVYRVDEKGRSYYFYYARGFHGTGYFHTPTYWSNSGRLRKNLTKQPTTRGCIRMSVSNAKYIYDLPGGTKAILH